MLEISKVQFTESKGYPEDVIYVKGSLRMHCEITTEAKVPRTVVHNCIRGKIWHKVYGDLRGPLAELERYALLGAFPEHQHRVRDLCDQLNALLAFKGGPE